MRLPMPSKARLVSALNTLGLVVVLVALFAYFSARDPAFATLGNVETLARQGTVTILAVLGMTFVIISGGIDLSIGSVVAFSAVVIATVIKRWGADAAVWAVMAGVASGALAGLLNGSLITTLRVAPFIVTLGTYLFVRGAALGIAGEQSVYPERTWINELLGRVPEKDRWRLLPYGVWITLALVVAAALALRGTVFGRRIRALGGNEQAARYAGLRIGKLKLATYMLNGFFGGLAGVMLFSRLSVGDPTSAAGLELDVIAAAVIGGASLAGGEGSIAGSVLGALIMVTLRAGLSQMGLSNWVQQMITGGVIVVAVAVDRLRRRPA